MFTRLLIGMIVLVLAWGTLPALLAQTTSESSTTATDTNRRVEELEKELQELRAEVAAMKQSSAAAANRDTSNAAVQQVNPTASASTPVVPANAAAATPAPDPLSGISSVLGGATLTGLVDGYFSYNVNQPADRISGLRLFDDQTNQFALNLIELGLVKTPDAGSPLGYNVTLGFGNAMNIVNSGDPSYLQYLKEAYLSYLAPVGKGLQIDFGKFVTPAGFEVIESNANWNYSRGLLFNYAIPFYHFGLRAKYVFNDKFSLTGLVVNGWNNIVDNNTGKTGGLSLAWTPTKKVSVTETWLGGPGATPLDVNNWRNLSDTVITYSPTSKLSLAVWGDYGRSEGFLGINHPVDWSGAAAGFKYQLTPKYAVATRYEYLDDPDGVATGSAETVGGVPIFLATPQHVQEFTGTLERNIARHLLARAEFRHDISNEPTFLKGTMPVTGQSTVDAGLIFVLEPNK